MAAMSVEEVYERYVLPLPEAERRRLVEMTKSGLEEQARPEKTRSLLDLEGLGAEIWRGIDAQEYVNELRAEWDHRP